MSVLEHLGSAVGTVVGTIFGGPVGTVVGGKVGGYIGEAIDEQTPPPPRRAAPPPKPAVKSKTIWLNLLPVIVALLGWAETYDWNQVFSPATVVTIGGVLGVINIVLRFVTKTGIGRPEE